MDESIFERSHEGLELTDAETQPAVSPEFAARVDDVLTRYGDLWEALADADA